MTTEQKQYYQAAADELSAMSARITGLIAHGWAHGDDDDCEGVFLCKSQLTDLEPSHASMIEAVKGLRHILSKRP
jgi:hypothetical protein